jgi:hypothetical protein
VDDGDFKISVNSPQIRKERGNQCLVGIIYGIINNNRENLGLLSAVERVNEG